jgi:rhomboid-like protein
LRFQDTELSDNQIRSIFGRYAPPSPWANRLLRILHARRIDGTLDLPLPKDLESYKGKIYPRAVEDALEYLRSSYPLDEDEAIIHRLAREDDPREQDHPSVLAQRGQDLGLYKAHKAPEEQYYGPQSGYYQAPLSDKPDDPYGVSVFDQIREENIAKREQEEEELQAHIDMEMSKAHKAQEEQIKALAQRPEQGLDRPKELRPPNSFERWVIKARQQGTSKLTLDSPEIAQMSAARRLLPSLLFATALCVGCYFFAQNWTRPKVADRLFPDIALSYATIGGIVALNVAVWFLWKLPPQWKMLNKYFVFVPAYPYTFSILGNLFSQQTFRHLGFNMLGLVVFGLPLHEEVGRGNFLAIYLASGLISVSASFVRFAALGMWQVQMMGASGCVYGAISGYLALHME